MHEEQKVEKIYIFIYIQKLKKLDIGYISG